MRKLYPLLIALVLFTSAKATNHCVDAVIGKNGYTGFSPAQAFQPIQTMALWSREYEKGWGPKV